MAISTRDFGLLADVIEEDALMMHAVMMTSQPSLIYWCSPTLDVMHHIRAWRTDGIPVAFTIDAGPNVHVISTSEHVEEVTNRLRDLEGVYDVLVAKPGGGTVILH